MPAARAALDGHSTVAARPAPAPVRAPIAASCRCAARCDRRQHRSASRCMWLLADVRQRRRSRPAFRSGRECSGTPCRRRSGSRWRTSMSISSSVSRQSLVKPGHITSTRFTPFLRQLLQRRRGIGLQPLGLAEARLERHQVFLLATGRSAVASRRAVLWHSQWYGSPSISVRLGTPWKLITSLLGRGHALSQCFCTDCRSASI